MNTPQFFPLLLVSTPGMNRSRSAFSSFFLQRAIHSLTVLQVLYSQKAQISQNNSSSVSWKISDWTTYVPKPHAGFKMVAKLTNKTGFVRVFIHYNDDWSFIPTDFNNLQDCPVFHALLCWGKLFLAIGRRNLSPYIIDYCCTLRKATATDIYCDRMG